MVAVLAAKNGDMKKISFVTILYIRPFMVYPYQKTLCSNELEIFEGFKASNVEVFLLRNTLK